MKKILYLIFLLLISFNLIAEINYPGFIAQGGIWISSFARNEDKSDENYSFFDMSGKYVFDNKSDFKIYLSIGYILYSKTETSEFYSDGTITD